MKKKVQIRNPLEKIQTLIDLSIPFSLKIEQYIINASLFVGDKFKRKEPTNDLKNVVDWLWWQSKKHYPERFENE